MTDVRIHETALVSPEVRLGPGCEVGPFCVIDGPVILGAGNRLISHVRIEGETEIGENNTFHPFSVVGAIPQDLKYQGERAFVVMGSGNVIREGVTIHRGTKDGAPSGEGLTRLGNKNLIMAYSHVAHDCQLGSGIVIANATQIAGHVIIEDYARLGGANLVVQHVRVGAHAFAGAGCVIRKDIAPYVLGSGPVFKPSGINRVGLERAGFSRSVIEVLREAFRLYFLSGLTHAEALVSLKALEPKTSETERFIHFIEDTRVGVHR